jgi:pyrophosphate--fructose-6-phosphate 1-phosphotransferase
MDRSLSPFERARAAYEPRVPALLARIGAGIDVREIAPTAAAGDDEEVRARFPRTFGRPLLELAPGATALERRPLRVGVVLSGGQAPGGHNVIAGLHDALQAIDARSGLVGFLGGPRGILEGRTKAIDTATLAPYRNSGGFDLIGSGRDKLETPEQLATCRATCERLALDGLVIVGGDDSNTNAAVLAEFLLEHGSALCVVGVPKTIDGDLRGPYVETSFGFDTATRVYAELIGNIGRDAQSACKYWHFIRLMGRSASHVTLECALLTQPNVALIGEEVRERGLTLAQVVEQVAGTVARRAAAGRPYGVCLIPEGLIEFVPEIERLIAALNAALDVERLPAAERRVFDDLPSRIREQLLLDRDSHGNVQVSKIDTERLLIDLCTRDLARRRAAGTFAGPFQVQGHFFGYEGRAGSPSDFDADYADALGRLAALLVALGRTGYLCSVRNLVAPRADWRPAAVPLTSMMRMEPRRGRRVAVIAKALVRTDAEPFRTFAERRAGWVIEDRYLSPGAIQYFGPAELGAEPPLSLRLAHGRP